MSWEGTPSSGLCTLSTQEPRKYSNEQDRRGSQPAFTQHTVQAGAKTTEQEILAKHVPAEPVVGGPADLTFSRKLKNDQETEGGPGVARLGRRPQKEDPWWAEGMEGLQFTMERGSEGDRQEGEEGEGPIQGSGKF